MASRGKRIDRWAFALDGIEVICDVRMLSGKTTSTTKFLVELPQYDIEVEDADINALRTKVEALLRERAAVVWEPYLYVKLEGNRPGTNEDGEKLDPARRGDMFESNHTYLDIKLTIERYELTTIAGDKKHRRAREGRYNPSRHVYDGWPEDHVFGADAAGERRRSMYGESVSFTETAALIADTPENRAALESIRTLFGEITSRLDTLLHPKAIAETFALLSKGSLPLLALSDGSKPASRKKAAS